MNVKRFDAPSEQIMLETFGIAPLEAVPRDGYWCYQLTDKRSVTLRLSFDLFQRSIQTVLSINNTNIVLVVQEGALTLKPFQIKENQYILRGTFDFGNAYSQVDIQFSPLIDVKWSSLIR